MTRPNTPSSIVVGVRDADDLPVVRHAFSYARKLDASRVCLVHVITDSEQRAADGAERLERFDARLVANRQLLWNMAQRAHPDSSPAIEAHIDPRITPTVTEGLMGAAHDHAAVLIVVGGRSSEEQPPGRSVAEELARLGPCSVMVVRPKTTPTDARPLTEPPPTPGEHHRRENATSSVHVYLPTTRRTRQGRSDLTGPLDFDHW